MENFNEEPSDDIKKTLGEIGKAMKEGLPEGMGFAYLLFDYGANGRMFYISSAERDNMIEALEEFTEMLKKDREKNAKQ
jgi:hypothetical protein